MRRNRMVAAMLCSVLIGFFVSSVSITVGQLPDDLTVRTFGTSQLSTFWPTSVEYRGEETATARLFGLFNVKSVSVSVASPKKVKLGGTVFGLRMHSDGVMVVGLSDFLSDGAKVNPAREADIKAGDVIQSVNGKAVSTNKAFAEAVKQSGGSLELKLVTSEGAEKKVSLQAKRSDADESLKTGMWVRDSAAGIGTLTFIDPESGRFGGLGHGICDSDTQTIVPLFGGDIVEAEITDIRRGVRGAAGEIRGFLGSRTLGEISANTICGTFGDYTADLPQSKAYEVALRQEVRPGAAKVLCTVESGGQPTFYDIRIDKINYNGREPAKNMIIKVTDKRLLEKTGGIVQGMSGSPIVQNGKFVGAVTHVFVNDPTCGYAIFAENMVNQIRN